MTKQEGEGSTTDLLQNKKSFCLSVPPLANSIHAGGSLPHLLKSRSCHKMPENQCSGSLRSLSLGLQMFSASENSGLKILHLVGGQVTKEL